MLYLGADHRGFKLKKSIKQYLEKQKIPFKDCGNFKIEPQDDYPDFAFKVAKKVSENPEINKGIVLCGSGVGVCIAANRFKSIRAGLGGSPAAIKAARNDDDINVLCLAADYISEKEAILMINNFLNVKFSGKERHKRRLKKIEALRKRV